MEDKYWTNNANVCGRDFAAQPQGRTNISVFAVNKPVSRICQVCICIGCVICEGGLFVLNNNYILMTGGGGRKIQRKRRTFNGFSATVAVL